jgi:hypothetical protein
MNNRNFKYAYELLGEAGQQKKVDIKLGMKSLQSWFISNVSKQVKV